MTDSDVQRESSMMASVNSSIDRLHSSLGFADSEFFCECGHAGCKERITLAREEFASSRGEGRPVVVGEHANRLPRPLGGAPRLGWTRAASAGGGARGR